GGSQGIGKGIAIALADAGADVLIQYHSAKDKALMAVDEIISMGKKSIAIHSDFTTDEAPELFFERALKELSEVDILVNCAAAYDRGPLLELTYQKFAWMQKVNIEVPFRLIQKFAHHIISRKTKGNIINISSISGIMPSTTSCLNSCSKAGLNMLTRCAALELAEHQIRVNGIAPGTTETESNLPYIKQDPSAWQHMIENIPLKRVGYPKDIAALAVFLASDVSDWITGVTIPCDGGKTIGWL
ncbi:MAG: SDR family oxidoreductase, partial [Gammaproteobacteria bacterium]|nr:SDR family oxidoreductase [Gammaproteobacteria bacterium]